jgi:L-lysine 2,3-aminomutase
MVAAGKKLLKMVRRLAVRDELRAMRLRGRLIVAAPARPANPA